MNTTPSSTPRISSTSTCDGIAVTRTPRRGNWPMPDQQVGAARQAGNSNKRALVLAGGGAAGNAWELGRSRMPLEWGMDLATQVDELRAGGSRVETVFPDGGAGDVFDANASDPSTRLRAARGGHDQGRALAERLPEIWRWRPQPLPDPPRAPPGPAGHQPL